jgi:mannosylglycerate hydrolase
MTEQLIAHCIHHTHWDPYWWFTPQESNVVFCYNMREMLRAFEAGEIEDFFLDGQTTATYEYLQQHPEDTRKVSKWVKNGKLAIGPFVSQLDTYLSSAESVINNLRLGIKYAKSLGKANRVAYLADPFGYSTDMPKIFNQCGIREFVFTRGWADIYGPGIEFYFRSNDGSEVLCHVLLSGYGYGANAFRNKTLFTDQAEDYNKIDVARLIDRLVERSTLENEFVFPLGFDNHPIMRDIPEKLAYYNETQSRIQFKYTNWPDFFERVRKHGRNIKTFEGEILSPQFHRIHINGMNSARSDIKTLIDRVDRRLVYELQPMMTLLDAVGIPYDQGIIDQAWYHLVNCQTHGSATHGDITNEWVKDNASYASNIARGAVHYLSRLISVSVKQDGDPGMPLVVFNTLPWKRELIQKMSIVTSTPGFSLELEGKKTSYDVIEQVKHYFGVVRKDPAQMNEDKWFYRTEILCNLGDFDGISYKTFSVVEKGESQGKVLRPSGDTAIENEHLSINCGPEGITISDKGSGQTVHQALYFEDGGDEGDSYDYDYPAPEDEWLVIREITQRDLKSALRSDLYSELRFEGEMEVPSSLEKRKQKLADAKLQFSLTVSLTGNSSVLRVAGEVVNTTENHRLRIGLRTEKQNEFSYAGTQYSVIKRACLPEEMAFWKERNYFEEPSATRPLLNHVSAVDDKGVITIFTRSLKEYEFIGDGFSDLMLTVLRAMGYVGLPDLHRRPGRPSGMPERLLPASTHQLMGKTIEFDFGIGFSPELDANFLFREYAEFAVDPLYGQNQTIDPTFYPISYFPINPWPKPLTRQYSFASLQEPGVSFGTFIKSDGSPDYILRLFNAESSPSEPGQLILGEDLSVTAKTDLMEETRSEQDELAAELKAGELLNVVIKQNRKEE